MLRYGDMDNTTMIGVVGSPKTTTSSLDQCLSPPSSWSSLIYTIYSSFLHFFAERLQTRQTISWVANLAPLAKYCGQHATLVPRINGVLVILSLLGWEPNFHTDNQTIMPGQCFRHCLENGCTMGYCSRSPLSNPWTRDILWTTDIGRPQTHTLWGVSKTFKNIYIDPKKDAEKCVQDGSSMIYFPEFPGVHFFYRLGGLLYKSSNMLGELWFCKVMLKRMDFAKDPVPNSHPKNRETNEQKEQTTMDR